MKGIVVKFFEEKGFGFIKDENKEEHFFHIKNIKEKNMFLNNLSDYCYYTDCDESKCYVVNFTPSQNDKGSNALDINLTNQIFNDKSINTEFEAKIVDLKYDVDSLTRVVSGITKGKPQPLGATAGRNGTFRIGYPEVLREVNIYFHRTDDIGWGTIDVRELVLSMNDRKSVTDKLINTLKNHFIEKKIMICQKDNKWSLKDNSILRINGIRD
jgi:hypothetical protein